MPDRGRVSTASWSRLLQRVLVRGGEDASGSGAHVFTVFPQGPLLCLTLFTKETVPAARRMAEDQEGQLPFPPLSLHRAA